jgi:hypothetical protein
MKIFEQQDSIYNSDLQTSNIPSLESFTRGRNGRIDNGATATVTSLSGVSRNAPFPQQINLLRIS